MKITTIVLTMFYLWLGMPVISVADMSSDSYRITSSVMSSGGGNMVSATYWLTGTLGQSSPPVDDPLAPPFSDNYEMLTGFWYTLGGCQWDIDPEGGDGDVDGADLAEFIKAFDPNMVPVFADEFGLVGCR